MIANMLDNLSIKNKVLLIGVPTLLFSSPLAYDLYRKITHTGIYRTACEGSVFKVKRTWIGYLDLLDCSDSRHKRRRRNKSSYRYRSKGHYIARVKPATGKTYSLAISGQDYERFRQGQYVICKEGKPTFYPSRAKSPRGPQVK